MNLHFKRVMIEATGRRAILLTKLWIHTESLKHAKRMQSEPYIKACKRGIFSIAADLRNG